MSYVASWSGGKDSCLSCYKAIRDGYSVSHLLNFISKDNKRVSAHGTTAELIQTQSNAIGIPLIQKETTWGEYEQAIKDTVKGLAPKGVKGMIFGDIYVQDHKDWVERVCGELGIEAVEPLWGKETENIFLEFLDAGFEAIIVSVKSGLLDEEWVGRKVDREFLKYLKDNNLDVCGENGEYHTFVVGGPMFKRKIKITNFKTVARDDNWFLDAVEYLF